MPNGRLVKNQKHPPSLRKGYARNISDFSQDEPFFYIISLYFLLNVYIHLIFDLKIDYE